MAPEISRQRSVFLAERKRTIMNEVVAPQNIRADEFTPIVTSGDIPTSEEGFSTQRVQWFSTR